MLRKSVMARVLSVVVSLSLISTGCASSEAAKPENAAPSNDAAVEKHEEIKIRIAHLSPEEDSIHKGFVKFKEVVEAENVGLTVEIFPSGQLVGSDRDSIEGVKLGEIDMTSVAEMQFAPHVKEFFAFNGNYLFDSMSDAKAKLSTGVGGALKQATLDAGIGVRVATFFGGASRSFWNNVRPIESIADYKGLKVRSAENPINIKELEDLGAIPTPLAWGELFTALQQGTVDGLASPQPPIVQQGLIDVLKYGTATEHSYYVPTILMSDITYSKFDDAQKAAFEKAITEATDYQWELALVQMKETEDKLKELDAAGKFKYTVLTDEQKAEFKEAYINATEELVKEKCGEEILSVFRKK